MSRQLHGLLRIDMGHQGRHADLYGLTNREESEDRTRFVVNSVEVCVTQAR